MRPPPLHVAFSMSHFSWGLQAPPSLSRFCAWSYAKSAHGWLMPNLSAIDAPLWYGEDERVGCEEISGVVVGLRLAVRRVLRVLQMDVADLVRAREPRSVVVGPGHVVDDYLRNRKVGVVYAE